MTVWRESAAGGHSKLVAQTLRARFDRFNNDEYMRPRRAGGHHPYLGNALGRRHRLALRKSAMAGGSQYE